MRVRFVIAILASPLVSHAQSTSGTEIWPDVEAQVQLPGAFRFLAEGQLKEGLSYDATQWIIGGDIAYQWQRILGRHVRNINEDREHLLVLGVGYQYLQTNEPTPQKDENRFILDATLNFRLGAPWLLADRNQYEYRWVNGAYSTRYRNRISAEYDVTQHERPIRPYASAEFFYDVTKSEWSEEQYSAGVEWPILRTANLRTYYLSQTCPSCKPRDLNVIGIGLTLFRRVR